MGYKLDRAIKIDLSELGDNNGVPFFVQIKNPKLQSYNEKTDLMLAGKGISKDENGHVDLKSLNADTFNSMRDYAKSLIVSWNLLDLETENPVMPTDADALDHVPGLVVEAIQKKIGELSKQGETEIKNS
jgi:hypothetical protein